MQWPYEPKRLTGAILSTRIWSENRPAGHIVDGALKTTPAPNGNRDYDRLDCGFWHIPDAAAEALGAVEFLDASRLSHNRAPTEHRYYMAMGYRVSRNKDAINHREKTIETRASSYSGMLMEVPKTAMSLGFSAERHFFLPFNKHVEDEDGNHANAFGPRGFSGGALVDLGDFTPVSAVIQ